MIKRSVNNLTLLLKSAIFTLRLRKDIKAHKGHVVLVYQMAKVGSTTVYQSLRDGLEIPVYHTHFLSAGGIQNVERFFRDAGAAVLSTIRYSAMLRRHLPDMRPVVITLVRDPIAREISGYFQVGYRVFDALKEFDGSGGA